MAQSLTDSAPLAFRPGLRSRSGTRLASLEDEIASTPKTAPQLHPSLADLYRRRVTNLQEALADPGTRMEALEISRGMIERVRVKTAENGVEIELVGEIANMVRLFAGSKRLAKEPYRSSPP
jgi:site-specific DNA recombinase